MKRFMSMFLVLIMIFSISTTAIFAEETPDDGGFISVEEPMTGSLENFLRINVYNNQFTDVPAGCWYEQAVKDVYEYGIMIGNTATTFNPNGVMTVAQMITIVSRLHNTYWQTGNPFMTKPGDANWYDPYVRYAIKQGIITADQYSDYNQDAARIWFCDAVYKALPAAAFEPINEIPDNSIPDVQKGDEGYDAAYTLYRAGIMNGVNEKHELATARSVARGEIAAVVARIADEDLRVEFATEIVDDIIATPIDKVPEDAVIPGQPGESEDKTSSDEVQEPSDKPSEDVQPPREPGNGNDTSKEEKPVEKPQEPVVSDNGIAADKSVAVGEHIIWLGMTENQLIDAMGTYDEMMESVYQMSWYVYGIEDYTEFVAVGVRDGKVIAISATGLNWKWNGYESGEVVDTEKIRVQSKDLYGSMYSDDFDGGKAYGIFIYTKSMRSYRDYSFSNLHGESWLVYHMTNAFRTMHDVPVLALNSTCETVASSHSTNMAENNFFSHKDQNGKYVNGRISEYNIPWITVGENISAGFPDGVEAFAGWVGSEGHRSTMLDSSFKELGVGAAYNKESNYYCYWTQVFVTLAR